MTMALTAREYFENGNLRDAIKAMNEEVKRHPTDLERRGLLVEFLCLAGDPDRADLQLEVMARQDPASEVAIAQFRQLIRAEVARRDWFTEGRLPELLGQVPPHLKHRLEAAVLLRENDAAGASRILAEAEKERPTVTGLCDGAAFDDMRDADDLTASLFEVLTSTGKYFWVPMDRVVSIEFHPTRRPRDLLWRRAHLLVRDGPEGEVFLPAIYPALGDQTADQYRLGRATDWRGGDGAPVRGIGQRIFLIGEETRPMLEITRIDFGARPQ
jgi:type VI secretion system protein ImpE